MATSTTNISNVSISVSGNTTKTATISWSLPSIPAGSTISSCTLTGTASSFTTGNKGATLTIGSTSVSSGSSFTVNLGNNNSTTSVTASFKGNHKQSNTSVTLSNLKYTVTYTEPLATYTVTFKDWDGTVLKTESVTSGSSATAPSDPSREGYKFTGWDNDFSNITSNLTVTAQYIIWYALNIKESGSWVDIGRVFRKVNGVWIEENNNQWDGLFSTNIPYVKRNIQTSPTAHLYSDGTMIFSNHSDVDNSHGDVVATYTGWDTETYTYNTTPWYNNRELITSIYLNDISVQSTYYWFYDCMNLRTVDGSGLYNVTDMGGMFWSCANLTSVNVAHFDTKNVTSMRGMFALNKALTSLDLSSFDTSNVVNMQSMFQQSSALSSLNLSNFNTSKVTDMKQMFYQCSSLSKIDLTSFDFTKVTVMGSFTPSNTTIYVKDEASRSTIELLATLAGTVIIGSPT